MVKTETLQDKLYNFHKSFHHPIDQEYPIPSNTINNLKRLRTTLIKEEYEEVINAIDTKPADEVLKELCDLVYVCVGFCITYGWDFNVAFNRVHASNMSKLDKQGNPVYRKDNKIIKSDQYKPPTLKDLV